MSRGGGGGRSGRGHKSGSRTGRGRNLSRAVRDNRSRQLNPRGITPTGNHVHNPVVLGGNQKAVAQSQIQIGENGWMKKLPKEYNLTQIKLGETRISKVEHSVLQKEMKNKIDCLRCNG